MPATGRYELVDRMVDGACWSGWRAHDSVLHRDVGLLVLATDHPRREAVAEAARRASLVADPRFLHVYDATPAGSQLWVVEEWAPGSALTERVADQPLPVEDACALGIQVAQALAAAHDQGVAHGALGPGDVRLTDDGRIKIDGLAVRALLEEVEVGPGRDGSTADSWAAAAVTYAALTGRWPGGPRDGMPGPPAGTSAVRPSLVRPGVPKVVDAAVAAALRSPPEDPADVARSMERVLSEVGRRSADRTEPSTPRVSPTTLRAIAAGAGAALVAAVVGGALWLGFEMTRDQDAAPPALISSQPSGGAPGSGAGPSSSVDVSARLHVVGAVDFDPDGNGEEEPELVPLAYDDNLATAWHTMNYHEPDLAPKAGVGVVFDLGRIETVGAVRLNLLGAGTSLQVRVSRSPGSELADFQKFGSATGLGDLVALRAPEPVQARYILVWLTRLPADGDGYRGGISEIEVARS